MKINPLTHSEEILMHIMWKLESAYLKDILAEYPEPKPHQNTVSTFVKILVDKEFLSVNKEGRIFRYNVAVPLVAYRNFLLRKFLTDYYNDDANNLVQNLTDEQLIPDSASNAGTTKKTLKPSATEKQKTPISDFINEITSDKKKKKGKKKKKKNGTNKNGEKN